MSELEDIKNWLNGPRDFNAGLMLHLAYFNDKPGNELLNQHRNAARLFQLLRDRFYELKEAVPVPVTRAVNVALAPGQTEYTVPEEYLSRWGELKTEQEMWSTALRLVGDGRMTVTEPERLKRAQLAKMIVAHEERLEALGAAINHIRKFGTAPVGFVLDAPAPKIRKAKPISKYTDSEIILRLKNNINPNISKLTKKIADKKLELPGLKGKDLDKANQKLTEWETNLKALYDEKERLLKVKK